MNDNEFIKSIRQVWNCLECLELGETFSHPVSLHPSEKFRDAAYDVCCSYENLYLVGLRNRDYNILLNDYSYFQFYKSQESAYRFAYYPNPKLGPSVDAMATLRDYGELVEDEIQDIEEFLLLVDDRSYAQHPPLIRYEYSPDQYKEFIHPTSHFHLGHHAENRWPMSKILTPSAFGCWFLDFCFRTNGKQRVKSLSMVKVLT